MIAMLYIAMKPQLRVGLLPQGQAMASAGASPIQQVAVASCKPNFVSENALLQQLSGGE